MIDQHEFEVLWNKLENNKYEVKSFLKPEKRLKYVILQNKQQKLLYSGKIGRAFSKSESYYWPQLHHRSLAPFLDCVRLPKYINVFISSYFQYTLRDIIHQHNFAYHLDCFNLKKMYIEDVLWGVDYIHRKSLCLLNISDENIFICLNENKAVIADFSSLTKIVDTAIYHFDVPSLYKAPELTDKRLSVTPIHTEIWSVGVLVLEIFLSHMVPWGLIDFDSSRVLEMILNLDSKLLKAANCGSLLTSSDVSEFKNFTYYFFHENPHERCSASRAATEKFIQSAKNYINVLNFPCQFQISTLSNIQKVPHSGHYQFSKKNISGLDHTFKDGPTFLNDGSSYVDSQLNCCNCNSDSRLDKLDPIFGNEIEKCKTWLDKEFSLTSMETPTTAIDFLQRHSEKKEVKDTHCIMFEKVNKTVSSLSDTTTSKYGQRNKYFSEKSKSNLESTRTIKNYRKLKDNKLNLNSDMSSNKINISPRNTLLNKNLNKACFNETLNFPVMKSPVNVVDILIIDNGKKKVNDNHSKFTQTENETNSERPVTITSNNKQRKIYNLEKPTSSIKSKSSTKNFTKSKVNEMNFNSNKSSNEICVNELVGKSFSDTDIEFFYLNPTLCHNKIVQTCSKNTYSNSTKPLPLKYTELFTVLNKNKETRSNISRTCSCKTNSHNNLFRSREHKNISKAPLKKTPPTCLSNSNNIKRNNNRMCEAIIKDKTSHQTRKRENKSLERSKRKDEFATSSNPISSNENNKMKNAFIAFDPFEEENRNTSLIEAQKEKYTRRYSYKKAVGCNSKDWSPDSTSETNQRNLAVGQKLKDECECLQCQWQKFNDNFSRKPEYIRHNLKKAIADKDNLSKTQKEEIAKFLLKTAKTEKRSHAKLGDIDTVDIINQLNTKKKVKSGKKCKKNKRFTGHCFCL